MSEHNPIQEAKMDRLLRVRGILIEEFDRYISSVRPKLAENEYDTMDILLDFEDIVFPSFAERTQKLYSKERKLEVMQANEEDSDDEAE